jgi:GAF domain-containing protein
MSSHEVERLQALYSYDILDTPPDGTFDCITSLAAEIFHVPVALVSFVDEDRIWFKSRYGLEGVEQIDRAPGLCASVIMSDEAYVVCNALEDPRTLANPLVAGAMGLRFYAAAPLITHDGYRLGTINIIDFAPREFDEAGEKMLRQLATIVMEQISLRLAARQVMQSLMEALAQAETPKQLDEFITVCAWTKKIKVDDDWLTFDEFLVNKLGLKVTHGMNPEVMQEFFSQRAV